MQDDINIAPCTFVGRMTACDSNVLVLDRFVPWRETGVGSPYVYVVRPSNRGDYLVEAVSEKRDELDYTLPFPPDWRGASADRLHRMTKIDDLEFCHPRGGLCIAKTLHGAVEAARLSLAGDWHHCYQCPWPCPACA